MSFTLYHICHIQFKKIWLKKALCNLMVMWKCQTHKNIYKYTIFSKGFTRLPSHSYELDIPFHFDVSPPYAALISYTLLRRPSTRFRSTSPDLFIGLPNGEA